MQAQPILYGVGTVTTHRLISSMKVQIGRHALEPLRLCLGLAQLGYHGSIHPTILCSPLVKRGAAHPMFAAKLRNANPILSLLQNPHDLGVGVSCLLHKISVDKSTANILLSHPLK